MGSRWGVLALLFSVRVTMAFQFQAVAALSPFYMESLGISLADVGLLIGLYLTPGIVFALPGGAVGRRFGDKRTVAYGMLLMLAGGLLIALAPVWEAQLAGRIVAGVGGVVLNVLMTKMVADWFAGRGFATAMAIFVNSWPVGIALALVALPALAQAAGLAAALWTTVGVVAAGLAALLALYREPQRSPTRAKPAQPLRGRILTCVLLAGGIWGLYNAALGTIFGFGPTMLVEQGWTPSTASATTSIALWLMSVSVPLGGLLADRLRQRDLVLAGGLAAFAALMLLAPAIDAAIPLFVALGIVGGLSAGPIMSLPADVLPPDSRAQGMGLFYSLFYLTIAIAPAVAGWIAELAGSAQAAFVVGGGLLVCALVLLAAFRAQTGARAPVVPAD